MKGTITWIDVIYDLPNPKHPNTRFTNKVILCLDDGGYVVTRGVWLKDKFAGWEHTDTPYNPTHWAYINQPE